MKSKKTASFPFVVSEKNIELLQAYLIEVGASFPLAVGSELAIWRPDGLGQREGDTARWRAPVFTEDEHLLKFEQLLLDHASKKSRK